MSAKTLPLPCSTPIVLLMACHLLLNLDPSGMLCLRSLEARMDQFDHGSRRANSTLRFFLECVQDIDPSRHPHCIDGSVCVSSMALDNFENCCASEASHRFRIAMLPTLLRHVECKTHRILGPLLETRRARNASPQSRPPASVPRLLLSSCYTQTGIGGNGDSHRDSSQGSNLHPKHCPNDSCPLITRMIIYLVVYRTLKFHGYTPGSSLKRHSSSLSRIRIAHTLSRLPPLQTIA